MIDFFILHKLVRELAPRVNGASIRSVGSFRQTISFQTGDDALFFYLNPDEARIEYGSSSTLGESERPHPFVAFITKELSKGRIATLSMAQNDRIVFLDIDKLTHLGMKRFRIVVEFCTRPCTAYLLDEGVIVSAFRLVRDERELVPGDTYILPTQTKSNPFTAAQMPFVTYNQDTNYADQLMQNFILPPHFANEIAYRISAGESCESVYNTLRDDLNKPETYIYNVSGKTYVTAVPYTQGECAFSASSANDTVRKLYHEMLGKEIARRQKNDLIQVCAKRVKHNEKILVAIAEEAEDFSDAERYKVRGDLLLTYGYMVKGYVTEIKVTGYDGNEVVILIDPERSVSENAERFYKKYQKAKRSVEQLEKRRAVIATEQAFLQDSLFFIEQSEDATLFSAIKTELEEQGIIKTPRDKKHKESKKKRPPTVQYGDYSLIYGRTAQENEFVTLKCANDQDMWLHVQNMPGAHVIIKSPDGQFSDEVMGVAAQIAVHFSKAKGGSKVPVDYTRKKHIRKPKGTPPGFVLYENFKTLITDYDGGVLEKIINS